MLSSRLEPVVGVLCIAAVVVAGCGKAAHKAPVVHLDTSRIAHKIERAIERRNPGLRVTVSCPAVVVRKKDGQFTCPIVTRDGRNAKALLKQLNDKGRVRYFIPSPPWRPQFGPGCCQRPRRAARTSAGSG
jgi:hypothetical protein